MTGNFGIQFKRPLVRARWQNKVELEEESSGKNEGRVPNELLNAEVRRSVRCQYAYRPHIVEGVRNVRREMNTFCSEIHGVARRREEMCQLCGTRRTESSVRPRFVEVT